MAEDFIKDGRLDVSAVFSAYRHLPAIVAVGQEPAIYTFEEIARRIQWIGRRFDQLGMAPGSRVAVYLPDSPLHFLIFFLSWIRKDLFVPLNVQVPLEEAIRESSPDAVIGPDWLGDRKFLEGAPQFISADSLFQDMRMEKAYCFDFPEVELDRECSMVFTSGSTGRPKGVVHTVGNHVYSAAGVISFFGLTPDVRWLVSLPLYHVGGLSIFVRTFLSGGAAVFPQTRQAVIETLAEKKANFISVVPTQLIRFMASPGIPETLSHVRGILLGGSPVPGWVIDEALDLSLPIIPSYGSTESCSLVTAVAPGADRAAYKTAGKLLPYRKLATGEDGRIRLGGKTRFAYYLENETPVFPFESGWFATSDLGEADADGNWRIFGRADDIFISGGENINPFEIERHLMAINGIDAAVVVPVPHPEFGLVPWAFVSSPHAPDPADIVSELRKTLPGFKVPKKILLMNPADTAAGIKTDRAFLKQKALQMAGG